MYNKYSDEIFSKLELSLYAIYNEFLYSEY